jgi:hypothetical protein
MLVAIHLALIAMEDRSGISVDFSFGGPEDCFVYDHRNSDQFWNGTSRPFCTLYKNSHVAGLLRSVGFRYTNSLHATEHPSGSDTDSHP